MRSEQPSLPAHACYCVRIDIARACCLPQHQAWVPLCPQSAALGLAIAGALALGYANIFVTAPSPENLRTLFEFVFKVSLHCTTLSLWS